MSQQDYGGFPSVDVLFDKDARLLDEAVKQHVAQMIESNGVTDLVAVSHGWNNNIPEAANLYARLFDRVRAQLDGKGIAGLSDRTFGVMAIFWPSKRFTDEDAIPGGAAAAEDARAEQIKATLDNLSDLFRERGLADEVQEAKNLVVDLEEDEAAQNRFVAIVSGLLSDSPEPDNGIDQLSLVAAEDGHEVLQALQGLTVGVVGQPTRASDFDSGGATELPDLDEPDGMGSAAGLGGIFNTIKDAALGLLNVTTYATMKDRAGVIGRVGVAPTLDSVQGAYPALRLHLVGHSFGGRLVTSAAAATSSQIATMTLLQAAYSHYGLAEKYDGRQDGFFRAVLAQRKVRGPILISHSVHDKAVGLAYPIASRLLRQQSNAFGDQNDPFGGMGRNGAQKTPEVPDPNGLLKPAGSAYDLRNGVPNNLNGDQIIQSHGDICRDEIAYATLLGISRA